MAQPVLRQATVEDAPRLADIADAAYALHLPRLPAGVRPAPMEADYEAAVRDAEVWVAGDGPAIAGFIVLVPKADHLLLENVAVHPDHQGQGVGTALLALAEERARALRLSTIRLYTNAVMVENQRLYQRHGYVEAERRREDGFDRVFYEKAIEPAAL